VTTPQFYWARRSWTIYSEPAAIPQKLLPKGSTDLTEPMQVVKQFRLTWDGSKVGFMGAGMFRAYKAVDSAVCYRAAYGHAASYTGMTGTRTVPEHTAGPFPHCTCGFYAMNDNPWDPRAWYIRAEHWGRTIRHSAGHRSQWQRVISVIPPAACMSCAGIKNVEYYVSPFVMGGAAGNLVESNCELCRGNYLGGWHRGNYLGGWQVSRQITLQEVRAALAPVELERMPR
jgi:hypothetical protein